MHAFHAVFLVFVDTEGERESATAERRERAEGGHSRADVGEIDIYHGPYLIQHPVEEDFADL